MKINIKSLLLIFVIQLSFNWILSAQEKSSASSPIELPDIIIERNAVINIQTGIKQFPDKPSVMNARELDSLNSLEKQQSLLLPPEPLPSNILIQDYKKGYLQGSFGRFSTANIEAGYGFNFEGYEFFANAGIDNSTGHLKNSDYSKLFFKINSDYIAPDKYWIFGGSRTRTSVNFIGNTYKLYSLVDAPSRNMNDFGVNIDVDGNYAGYLFKTGAGFNTMNFSTKLNDMAMDGSDKAVNGYLSIKKPIRDFELGGALNVDFHSVRGGSPHFMQAIGFATYTFGDLVIKGNAGFQAARSSMKIERGGFLLEGDIEYRISSILTFKGGILSGLERNSYFDMYLYNPYIDEKASVDYIYNMPLIKGFIYYHPNERISLGGGIKFGSNSRTPIYIADSAGKFSVNYQDINKLEAIIEGLWQPTSEDNIYFNLNVNYSALSSNNNLMPYIETYKLSAGYKKSWSDFFGTQIGLFYIGDRFTDIENKNKLDGYMDLRIKADYKILDELMIYAGFENLLNSNIFIWDGYKERDLFISAGILWQF